MQTLSSLLLMGWFLGNFGLTPCVFIVTQAQPPLPHPLCYASPVHWTHPCMLLSVLFLAKVATQATLPGGGTPYVMGDTYVPRFWPPFFTLAGSSTIFLGCFFSSTNTKTIFWVQILAKFDLFGPQIPFFPRSFWVQFSVARGTPPAIFGPSTPPGHSASHMRHLTAQVTLLFKARTYFTYKNMPNS